MSTSMFSPESFLDAQITEASVRRPPLTAGIDVIGLIKDVKARAWTGKDDPSKSGIAMDVTIEVDLNGYPAEKARLGIDKVVLFDSIMLNLTDSGAIDMAPGKNGRLRQYREALGMNTPGEVFSFRNMPGRPIRAKIKHDTWQGEINDKVDSVAKP